MWLFRLALRNARRNAQRSTLTAATVVLGTAMLTVALSWMDGVFGMFMDELATAASHVRIATPAYQEREELLPVYEHLTGLPDKLAVIEATSGVVGAYPHILTAVTLTAGDEIGEVFAPVHGLPLAWFDEVLDLDDVLSEGRGLQAEEGEILLGRSVAGNLGARVGDEVLLLGTTQDGAMSPVKGEVVGILTGAGVTVESAVFVPFEVARWMVDLDDDATTEIFVYGEHRSGARALAGRLRADPALDGLAVRAWDEAPMAAAIVVIADVVNWIISVVIVFICGIAVWNTMMMSVMERTSEIGVLRAMGMSGRSAVALFVVEGVSIAAVGGFIGVLAGSAVALYLQVHGVELGSDLANNIDLPMRSTLYAALSWQVMLTSWVLACCMALVGTALPAWRASQVEPVEAMRTGR